MKPDWKAAPAWANYLAMDEDGEWYWYEEKPTIEQNDLWHTGGRHQIALYPPNWRDTLEEKPVEAEEKRITELERIEELETLLAENAERLEYWKNLALRLKCCGNCAHYRYCDEELCEGCKEPDLEKWKENR
jgi:hypothetical protein